MEARAEARAAEWRTALSQQHTALLEAIAAAEARAVAVAAAEGRAAAGPGLELARDALFVLASVNNVQPMRQARGARQRQVGAKGGGTIGLAQLA